MTDKDIRSYFSKSSEKNNKNNQILFKKTDFNLKKETKEIKPIKNTKSKKKTIVNVDNNIEKKTPQKKKYINNKKDLKESSIKKINEILSKEKKTPKKNKMIIDDDDDFIVENDNKKMAGNNLFTKDFNEPVKIIKKIEIKPEKKKEKLVAINANDFFGRKIELKKNIEKNEDFQDDEKSNFSKKSEISKKSKKNEISKKKYENSKKNYKNYEKNEESNNNENNKNDKKEEINKDFKNIIDLKRKRILKNDNKNNNNNIFETPNINNNNNNNNNNISNLNTINNPKNNNLNTNNIKKPSKLTTTLKTENSSLLLSEKYKPKTLKDIIGNASQIKNISTWLDNWNTSILINPQKTAKNSRFGKSENITARAAIISGPPGIGKTSSIRVISSSKGYKTFELNASDNRNKETINNSVGFLMNNTTITDKNLNSKNLIIMDEVDGMAGNEDKGGIKALIEIVKKTKVPIIFICNDIYNNKLKSLLNYCYDVRFNKPDKRQIVNRLLEICKQEKISVKNLEFVVESFGNDIRQSLNYLDLFSRKKCLNDVENFKKDFSVCLSSFEVCKRFLIKSEMKKMSFNEKLDLFFVDFDLIPSLIQENFISCVSKSKSDFEQVEVLLEASESISFGDLIENKIHSQNNWNLLPNKGIHGAIVPASLAANFIPFPKFPEYFSKLAKIRKIKRQIKEIKNIFPAFSLNCIKNEIAPILFLIIVNNLIENEKNVDQIIKIFSRYKLSLMQFKDSLFDIQTNERQNLFNKINTKIKANFTKKLNEFFKNSIKPKIKRNENEILVKRDIYGNVIESENEDEIDEESSSSVFEPIKKKKTKK